MRRRFLIVLVSFAIAAVEAPPISRADGTNDDGSPLPDLAIARLGTYRWRWSFSNDGSTTIGFSTDGKLVVGTGSDGLVIWDADTGKEIRPREGHSGTVWEVMPTADGRHLLSRDLNRQLVWDLRTAKVVKRYPDDLPGGETPLYLVPPQDRMM